MDTFHKLNSTENKDTFIQEEKGLELLNKAIEETNNRYISIPKIVCATEDELEIEKIDIHSSTKESFRDLGIGLALLHEYTNNSYGLEYDNYIGLNKQRNMLSQNWGLFFVEYRLQYQINLIKDEKIKNKFQTVLDETKNNLIRFLNENCDKPSLVHGDLWGGNILFGKSKIYLIDPAVYFADREVDIAMTKIFSGFDDIFYKFYNKTSPLSKNYLQKEPIYNLYHYLNHYNLFGISYLNSCIECLNHLKTFK